MRNLNYETWTPKRGIENFLLQFQFPILFILKTKELMYCSINIQNIYCHTPNVTQHFSPHSVAHVFLFCIAAFSIEKNCYKWLILLHISLISQIRSSHFLATDIKVISMASTCLYSTFSAMLYVNALRRLFSFYRHGRKKRVWRLVCFLRWL